MKIEKTTLKAGTYFVGDPCYTVPEDLWMVWLDAADFTDNSKMMLDAEVQGMRVVGMQTKYGDGEYTDQFSRRYPVDAGLIGVVDQRLIPEDSVVHGSQKITFVEDIVLEVNDDGLIEIGNLAIFTGDEEEDEEDYDDED